MLLAVVLSSSATWAATTTFTASGTWNCPAGVTTVTVECWGGGGAGGSVTNAGSGTSNTSTAGGGGAGGAYAIKTNIPVTPGMNYTVTVGAGGTPPALPPIDGTHGDGGDSWFNTMVTVLAKGGGGGISKNALRPAQGNGGSCPVGSLGDIVNLGGSGANGNGMLNIQNSGGGGGSGGITNMGLQGGSPFGATAVTGGGSGGNGSSSSSTGSAGGSPGGGGGGGNAAGQNTAKLGGAGAGGKVAITYTATYTYNSSISSPWLTTLNWSPSGPPGAIDLALFDATTTQPNIGIAMSSVSSAESVGEIQLTGGANRLITNSSGTAGTLTLNGNPNNSIALQNSSANTLSLANGSGASMNVAFGNSGQAVNITSSGGITISSAITGNNGFTKTGSGSGVLTLGGVNTYSGDTTISAGTLALNGSGTIPSTSTNIAIASSATFDVSAETTAFAMGASQTLKANATGGNTTATITTASGKGLTLSAGGLVFTAYGGGSTAPLTVAGTSAGTLAMNSAPVTVNTTTPLAAGTYTLIAKSGSATVTGNPGALTMGGSSAGASASISVTEGQLILTVPSAPTIASSTGTSIGTTKATLNGNVTSDGGTALTDYGFYWSAISSNPVPGDLNSSQVSVGTSDISGAYSYNLTGLSVNTIYYYVAYAKNSVGQAQGSPVPFYTLANTPTAPTVGNSTASTLGVTIGSGDGNPSTTAYAIKETTTGRFVQANGSLPAGSGAVFQTAATWNPPGVGAETVTGLSPNTTYTFEVEAMNSAVVITSFGPAASGTTSSPITPTITVNPNSLNFSAVAVNGTSASQTYTVSGANLSDNIVITAPANFQISPSGGLGTFVPTLTLQKLGDGTVPSTAIYVQFLPTAQTSYSGNITHAATGANNPNVAVSGTGANAPSVTTQAATSQTSTGATLNGTVTATNGAAITDRGFYWSASPNVNPQLNGTQLDEFGTMVSAFSKALSGLSANTIYYYRAYAVNAIGTNLDGADVSFYTLANTPLAPFINGASTSSLNVAIGNTAPLNDGNSAATTYAIQETTSGKYVSDVAGTLVATADYETAATWGIKKVTGLSPATTYTFQVKAHNGNNVDTAFGPTKSANTSSTQVSVMPFTSGNLAVVRVGDGTETLSTNGNSIFIDEYTAGGTKVQSVPVPDSGANALIGSGGTISEGALMRSPDGSLLCMAGYNTPYPYSSSVSGAAANVITRAVGTLDVNANFTIGATTITSYSGNNFRGAATDGNNNFWGAGSGSGTIYLGTGTATAVQTATLNTRAVNIFNGNLYFSTGSTTAGNSGPGIYGFTGQPVTSATPTLLLPTSSPYGFAINTSAAGSVAYVADDGTNVERWDEPAGGNWTLTYTLATGHVRGLAVDFSDAHPVIYATTTETTANRLIMITDTGSSSTATTLATAPANTFFRGVAFTPKGNPTAAGNLALATTLGVAVTFNTSKLILTTSHAGDTLSVTGVSAASVQGGSVAFGADGLTIIYTPANGFTGADSFTYTLSDGVGSATGTVNVTVNAANVGSTITALDTSILGQVTLTASGIPGTSYTIQYSDDSGGMWIPFANHATAAPNGVITYTDYNPNPSMRWYRLAQ